MTSLPGVPQKYIVGLDDRILLIRYIRIVYKIQILYKILLTVLLEEFKILSLVCGASPKISSFVKPDLRMLRHLRIKHRSRALRPPHVTTVETFSDQISRSRIVAEDMSLQHI